jgi:hypothetical protein
MQFIGSTVQTQKHLSRVTLLSKRWLKIDSNINRQGAEIGEKTSQEQFIGSIVQT